MTDKTAIAASHSFPRLSSPHPIPHLCAAGQSVPADGVLIDGQDLRADESALTPGPPRIQLQFLCLRLELYEIRQKSWSGIFALPCCLICFDSSTAASMWVLESPNWWRRLFFVFSLRRSAAGTYSTGAVLLFLFFFFITGILIPLLLLVCVSNIISEQTSDPRPVQESYAEEL